MLTLISSATHNKGYTCTPLAQPYSIADSEIVGTSVVSHVYCRVQSYPDVPRQGAVRREWLVLCKGCNAVLGHQGSSLRAGREAAVRCVELLGKDVPLPAKHALRSTASRPAEPYNIRVTVHWHFN